jgi:hypothetical protein
MTEFVSVGATPRKPVPVLSAFGAPLPATANCDPQMLPEATVLLTKRPLNHRGALHAGN